MLKSQTSGKTLVFPTNKICIQPVQSPSSSQSHFEHLTAHSAQIGDLEVKSDQNSTRITNQEKILILPKEVSAISIEADQYTGLDARLSGVVEAAEASILGGLIATNIEATERFRAESIDADNLHVVDSLYIDSSLQSNSASIKNNLTVGQNVIVNGVVETSVINSQADLTLSIPPGFFISTPNIKYAVNINGMSVLDPALVKSFKVFIVTNNIVLNHDLTCDGIEIIIFNNNAKAEILVTNPLVICKIRPKSAKKLVYIAAVRRWIEL